MVIKIKNRLLQSASYIIGNTLIDCGDIEMINYYINSLNIRLNNILLTHCHYDHVYGLSKLIESYPQIIVYCGKLTYDYIDDENKNLHYLTPEYEFEIFPKSSFKILREGLNILNDGTKVNVISCPGHSTDSQSYIIGSDIFTGDAHTPFSKVFAKWPDSCKQDAILSEMKIASLVERYQLTVHPGHWQ